MIGSNYRIPQLNRKSCLLLFAWLTLLGTVFGFRLKASGNTQLDFPEDTEVLLFINCLMIGAFLGSLSGGCWVTTFVKRQWLRFGIQAGLVLLFTAALSDLVFREPWRSSLINCMGIILSQNMLFVWIKIPHFNDHRDASLRLKRQFSIGNLVMLTTAFALLLALTRWFETPVTPSRYWVVSIGIWVCLPSIAGLIIKAILNKSLVPAIWQVTASIVLMFAGAVGLAIAERIVSSPPNEDYSGDYFRTYVILYQAILVGYAAAIAVTAIAGRMGSGAAADA